MKYNIILIIIMTTICNLYSASSSSSSSSSASTAITTSSSSSWSLLNMFYQKYLANKPNSTVTTPPLSSWYISKLIGTPARYQQLLYCPNHKYIATMQNNPTNHNYRLVVVQATNNKPIYTQEVDRLVMYNDLYWSADGTLLAYIDKKEILTIVAPFSRSATPLVTLHNICGFAWSSHNNFAVIEVQSLAHQPGEASIPYASYSIATYEQAKDSQHYSLAHRIPLGELHAKAITKLCWNHNNKHIAVTSSYYTNTPYTEKLTDNTLIVYDTTTEKPLFHKKYSGQRPQHSTFSPDGRLLAVLHTTGITFYDLSGKEIIAYSMEQLAPRYHIIGGSLLWISPHELLIYLQGTPSTIIILNPTTSIVRSIEYKHEDRLGFLQQERCMIHYCAALNELCITPHYLIPDTYGYACYVDTTTIIQKNREAEEKKASETYTIKGDEYKL